MKLRRSPKTSYRAPERRAHRGFAYLDDDIVINSLSALESGKVDEVVEKINLAQERGLSVGITGGGGGVEATASGTRKGSESLQAEVIRRRTRFSVFELWYESLTKRKAIGTFDGWGADALQGAQPGDVVELRGRIEIVPLQVGLRAYLWFVNEVRAGNTLLGEIDKKSLDQPEKTVKFLVGKRDEVNATFKPLGDQGPAVAMTFLTPWVIESISRWNGVYTLVAQVEEVLEEGQAWQAMRIIEDAPLTPLEEKTLIDAVEPFRDGLKGFGIEMDEEPTKVKGPALVLRPIALYR